MRSVLTESLLRALREEYRNDPDAVVDHLLLLKNDLSAPPSSSAARAPAALPPTSHLLHPSTKEPLEQMMQKLRECVLKELQSEHIVKETIRKTEWKPAPSAEPQDVKPQHERTIEDDIAEFHLLEVADAEALDSLVEQRVAQEVRLLVHALTATPPPTART